MNERLTAPALGAFALLLAMSFWARMQTSAAPIPKPGLFLGDSLVVDAFDSVNQWTTNPAAGVEITIHSDSGREGRGMRLDFDFHGHPGYAIVRREIRLDLPANFEFRFAVRGEAPVNTLEFKLVDTTNANVWWSNNPGFTFSRDWRTIGRKKNQICFAWGPAGEGVPFRYDVNAPDCRLGLDIDQVSAIEFAITAGSGGKGSIWIDDLILTRLDPAAPPRYEISDRSDIAPKTIANPDRRLAYFEFQVEKPAVMVGGQPMPSYPTVMESSGLAGEVQAQFVVTNTGKIDTETFRVLKSNNELLTNAVKSWLPGVIYSPALIGGKAVNQLVQVSIRFEVPRR